MSQMKMVQCSTKIGKSAIRRESIDGVEHIIVSSSTLPDNIVMNGCLYSADEINKSYQSLERTLAPIEHPTDKDGNYISASDPDAIHKFHAGAFNVNVKRENGRVHIEKHINVQEALKTNRGKRLIERVEELENNPQPRPIHTSVGVFVQEEDLSTPKTNAAGVEYQSTAKIISFDHDAILLDSVGAATPSQGVGMAVNSEGKKIKVNKVLIPNEEEMSLGKDTSLENIRESVGDAVRNVVTADWTTITDIVGDQVIFETPQGFSQVQWKMANGVAVITGIPLRVDQEIIYKPKVNKQEGVSKMKELIVNALKEKGVETEGLTDAELVDKYQASFTVNKEEEKKEEKNTDIGEIVANAVKPLFETVKALSLKVNAKEDADKTAMAELVGNSDKYPSITVEQANGLPTETLKGMAASLGDAYGIPLTTNSEGGEDGFAAPSDMPE
jgi:hypothetical protein